ncbi:glycosyl hydrolase [Candidatus Omnitrophota bacterium]
MNLKEFIDPPKHYRPSPFWSWNFKMEPAEIENRIRDMKKKGFGGFFMHSRTGLRTGYLDDDWMRAVRRGVEVAREVKMESWLYDEDRWPSGYCGGKTTASNAENLAMALTWTGDASALSDAEFTNVLAYTKRTDGKTCEILDKKPEELNGIGAFFTRRYSRGHFWYNNENYIDLLNPATVQDFIENTYERYSKLFRYDFGEHMPGIFTDEPNLNRTIKWFDNDDHRPFSFPWTPGFDEYFEKKFGYSPLENLHHLLSDSEDGFRFRHDFRRAVNERFIESYTVPLSSWCREHELKLTGHYLYEDEYYPMITSGGAVMPHYEYMDVPGIDHLGRNIKHPWTIKQVASVANQMGKKRVISELFGASGHSMSFEDMKWIADFNCVLGITFLCPHLVQYSLTGERKRDFPPTFSYHQPYWDHIRVINDYCARISWAAAQGTAVANVLVMTPTTSAYGVFDIGTDGGGEALKAIEQSYHTIVTEFLAAHIAFDLGDERILARHAKASGDKLAVGNAGYSCVLLPPSQTWLSTTLDVLESYKGQLIVIGEPPKRVDGAGDERMASLLKRDNVTVINENAARAVTMIAGTAARDVSVTLADGAQAENVYVNHRVDAEAHIVFLANTDRTEGYDITVTVQALGGVVELDPLTGRAYRYASEVIEGQTMVKTRMHPAGSRIFLIDQTQTSVAGLVPDVNEEILTIEGPYAFTRVHENILTLDRCSLDIDGSVILTNEPVWKARKKLWQATGIDEFEGCQPWFLEEKNVRTRTNKSVLTFTFEVTDIPEIIELAVESADRFTIEINGVQVESSPGKWHIDRNIQAFDIHEHVTAGTNTIKASTDFLWDTEIEDIYLVGDFAVGTEQDGFPIIAEPETLEAGNWVEQGYPFYSGSMIYKMEFELDSTEQVRYEIDLTGAKGSTFFVVVNETEVGEVPFSPFRGDITGALKEGTNTIEIEVISTLRNTLGPLHHVEGDNLDWTGPEQFIESTLTDEQARITNTTTTWNDSYHFATYGLLEPPKLIRIS